MPRTIRTPKGEDGEINHAAMTFADDDISDDEVELEESDESPEVQSKAVVVHFREKAINRIWGKTVLKSGGDQTRYFTPEKHGKKWKELGLQFVATLQLEDENKHQRPKYLGHEVVGE